MHFSKLTDKIAKTDQALAVLHSGKPVEFQMARPFSAEEALGIFQGLYTAGEDVALRRTRLYLSAATAAGKVNVGADLDKDARKPFQKFASYEALNKALWLSNFDGDSNKGKAFPYGTRFVLFQSLWMNCWSGLLHVLLHEGTLNRRFFQRN